MLEIKQIKKSFEGQELLKGVDLRITTWSGIKRLCRTSQRG